MFTRRICCHTLQFLLLLSTIAQATSAQNSNAQPAVKNRAVKNRAVKNRAPLAPNALSLLPLTSIKPKGWLRRQLKIQADGLTGHLDEFWPDVGQNSGWLGGAGE